MMGRTPFFSFFSNDPNKPKRKSNANEKDFD